MLRFAKYIEHEFDRNAIFFAQAHSRLLASYDFINYILRDDKIINLTENERIYVDKIRNIYIELADLSQRIAFEIQNYKEAYQEFLCEDISDD